MKKNLFPLSLVVLVIVLTISWIQNPVTSYTVDLTNNHHSIISGHLQLGAHTNPEGETLGANSLYFTKNGKPWFPVMGEFHFSRYPRAQWEESILKMKAAGIDVIATYVFWIYHEEEEGKWNWTGNRDLHYFASLCAKNNMKLFVRIGPWCHGEVRNGGFPDWLLQKTKTRRNDSAYLSYVNEFYAQISRQLNGAYFKDGGPVIGVQIENEFRFNNPAGLQHILTLKKMAREEGIDVPYYTATGWPGSNLKQTELIPVWGAYPEAPWDKSTATLKPSENYLFDSLRSDPSIGNDLLGNQKDTTDYSGYRYPYATAEMGGGNQVTYHRRPIIGAKDVTALAYVKTGSGANLMGYYMFHGGSNALGNLSTLQESKATKYPNDYPIINYDFYAPIGEWGQLRPSYKSFKLFHLFLNDFGDRLATTYASFPDQKPTGPTDTETLRWAVRSANNSGFVFISNYQRQVTMKDLNEVQLQLKLNDGKTVTLPDHPVTIKKDAQMIWPFNFKVEDALLNYATTQPLCRLQATEPVYVFFAPEGIQPEYVFAKKGIETIQVKQSMLEETDSTFKVAVNNPGTSCMLQLKLANGKNVKVLTLTHQQALNAWKGNVWGEERLFLSEDDLLFKNHEVQVAATGRPQLSFSVYPEPAKLKQNKSFLKASPDGLFAHYTLALPEKKRKVVWYEDEKLHNDHSLLQKNLPSDTAGSLPLYGPKLSAIPTARYWKVVIPKTALQGVSDAFLQINYTGDTQGIYLDGKLIADDFYAGLPMTLSLKQFAPEILGKELVVLITPLTDAQKIYFEPGVREPLAGKVVAAIQNISLIPQYQTTVTK